MGLKDKLLGNMSKSVSDIHNQRVQDFLNDDDIGSSTIFNINTKIVTREQAEQLAIVNMGINSISDAIAEMPVYLYKRDKNGGRDKVKNDVRNKLLNMNNGSYSNAFNMKKSLIADYLFHGNGYLDIQRDSKNKITSLIHIPYRDITLLTSSDINKRNAVYRYQYWGMNDVQAHNVLNLVRNPKYCEMIGFGLLDDGQLALASLMAIEDYMNSMAESGFSAKGVITKDTVMSKQSRASLMNMLKQFFGGANANKNGGVLLLDDGMKYQQLTQSSQELELLNQKDFFLKDVARLLNIPLSILGIATSGMTYSNEQQLKMTFLKQTLMPIIRNVEQALNQYLLTEKEKNNGYFFEFDYQNILKVSPQEEMATYGKAVADNLLMVDEARARMNLPPLENEEEEQVTPKEEPQYKVDESEVNENESGSTK